MYPKASEEHLMSVLQSLQLVELMDAKANLEASKKLELDEQDFFERDVSDETYDASLSKRLEDASTFLLRSSAKKQKTIVSSDDTYAKTYDSFDVDLMLAKLQSVEEISNEKERLENLIKVTKEEETLFRRFESLSFSPMLFDKDENINCLIGDFSAVVKPELESGLELMKKTLVYPIYEDTSRMDYAFLIHNDESKAMGSLLKECNFHRIKYRYGDAPKEMLAQTLSKLDSYQKELVDLQARIEQSMNLVNELKAWEEVVLALEEARDAKRLTLTNSHDYIVLRAWMESDKKEFLEAKLKESIPNSQVYIEYDDEVRDKDDVPTKLKNSKVVEPFESLTEMYSMPKYDEIDPTPYFTPFYMVFFGMMVADIGYGLVMLLLTSLALKFYPMRKSQKKFIKFFQILSVPIMLWGVIYGSLFGASIGFEILSTTNDMTKILLLSVIFGFIQLCTGLLIGGVEKIKRKEYVDSVGGSFSWLFLLIGLALIVLDKFMLHTEYLTTTGIVVCILCAVAVVICPALVRKNKAKGIAVGLYDLYGATSYIGDLVSYTRLMALGISGASIGAAFNMLIGYLPGAAQFTVGIVLLIALHIFNLFLSLLSAYVHGARLQYVEFFGKFYEGGGRGFTPFKPKEKYIDFTLENEKGGK